MIKIGKKTLGDRKYIGFHYIIDLIDANRLDDIEHIENTLRKCVEVSGATLLHIHLHHFNKSNGVSGVAILAESHITIHTWPEYNYAAADIFMCGDTDPKKALDVLINSFSGEAIVSIHPRGLHQ